MFRTLLLVTQAWLITSFAWAQRGTDTFLHEATDGVQQWGKTETEQAPEESGKPTATRPPVASPLFPDYKYPYSVPRLQLELTSSTFSTQENIILHFFAYDLCSESSHCWRWWCGHFGILPLAGSAGSPVPLFWAELFLFGWNRLRMSQTETSGCGESRAETSKTRVSLSLQEMVSGHELWTQFWIIIPHPRRCRPSFTRVFTISLSKQSPASFLTILSQSVLFPGLEWWWQPCQMIPIPD